MAPRNVVFYHAQYSTLIKKEGVSMGTIWHRDPFLLHSLAEFLKKAPIVCMAYQQLLPFS